MGRWIENVYKVVPNTKKEDIESNFRVEWTSDSRKDTSGRQWAPPVISQRTSEAPSWRQVLKVDTWPSPPECSLCQSPQVWSMSSESESAIELVKRQDPDPNSTFWIKVWTWRQELGMLRPTGLNLDGLASGLLERSHQNSAQGWGWKLQMTRKPWRNWGQMEPIPREPGCQHWEAVVFIQPEDPCGHTQAHLTRKEPRVIF